MGQFDILKLIWDLGKGCNFRIINCVKQCTPQIRHQPEKTEYVSQIDFRNHKGIVNIQSQKTN